MQIVKNNENRSNNIYVQILKIIRFVKNNENIEYKIAKNIVDNELIRTMIFVNIIDLKNYKLLVEMIDIVDFLDKVYLRKQLENLEIYENYINSIYKIMFVKELVKEAGEMPDVQLPFDICEFIENIFLDCLHLSFENGVNVPISSRNYKFIKTQENQNDISVLNEISKIIYPLANYLVDVEESMNGFLKKCKEIDSNYYGKFNNGSAATVLSLDFLSRCGTDLYKIEIDQTKDQDKEAHLHYYYGNAKNQRNSIKLHEYSSDKFIRRILNDNQILLQFVFWGFRNECSEIMEVNHSYHRFVEANMLKSNEEMLEYIKKLIPDKYDEFYKYLIKKTKKNSVIDGVVNNNINEYVKHKI